MRRRYLVNKPFQYRYMGIAVVPLVFLLSGLYYLIYYSVFNEMLIPEAIATTLLPAMKRVNVVILVVIPIALFIVLKMALVYSNRIIGPLPRIEREIDRIISGDRSIRLKVRSKDELNAFVNKINMLLDKIEKG